MGDSLSYLDNLLANQNTGKPSDIIDGITSNLPIMRREIIKKSPECHKKCSEFSKTL